MGDARGTPLYQLLDDFAGASLVAAWIWSQWNPDWIRDRAIPKGAKGPREGVCTGFAPGASALGGDGAVRLNHSSTVVGPFDNPDDSAGWHTLTAQEGPQSRRARRIDLWREDGLIKIDAAFQDSGPGPTGDRIAIHEYRVHGEVDPVSGVLVAMQVLPLILPFPECPGAAIKATRMIGQNVADFRNAVIDTLPTTMGCKHLNDVLRGLADFTIGAGMAVLFVRAREARIPAGVHSVLQLILLASLAYAVEETGWAHTSNDIFIVAPIMLLVFALAFDQGMVARVMKTKLPQLLGEWSYAIYLGQTTWLLLIRYFEQRLYPGPDAIVWGTQFSTLIWWLEPAGLVLVCVAWGALLAECIELPAAAWLRRRLGRRLDPQTIPTPS